MRAVARERGATLVEAAAGSRVDTLADGRAHDGSRSTTPAARYGPLTLALRGRHQVANALVAVRLLETLDAGGIDGRRRRRRRGARRPRDWPARLSVHARPGGRTLLVDGAHNPAGAAALAAYIAEEWPGGLPIVFGAMGDKRVDGDARARSRGVARPLVVTTAPGRRAATAAELALAAARAGLVGTIAEPDVASALVARMDARAGRGGRRIALPRRAGARPRGPRMRRSARLAGDRAA